MSWIHDKQQLHITIGSYPKSRIIGEDRRIDLQSDLAMVKAALLYADHAKLCSLASATLLEIVALTDIPEKKQWGLVQTWESWGMVDEDFAKPIASVRNSYEYARRRRHSSRGARLLKQFDQELEALWDDTVQRNANFVSGLGLDGITEAINSELLEVYTFDSMLQRIAQGPADQLDSLSSDFVLEYIEVVGAAVSDVSTYSLFDESTSDLISAGIAAGKIPVSDVGINRSKEIGLAADLFARLPLFPQATVAEILDIRRELETPLRRFRGALVNFSESVKNAAWDKDFPSDADKVFRRDVAPTILNIEEEVKANKFLTTLLLQFADKSTQLGGVVAGSTALSALAVRMLNLPLTDVAALSIGPLIAASGIAYSAYRKWRSQVQSVEQNNLFFYYEAGNLLEDRRYDYM